jgi:hypothetical protein
MVAHRGRVLRLACRLRVTGDVIVHKRGVRLPHAPRSADE